MTCGLHVKKHSTGETGVDLRCEVRRVALSANLIIVDQKCIFSFGQKHDLDDPYCFFFFFLIKILVFLV